ncbi:MAG: hypothetical protein GF405_05695 [Candidatus Eisenbacteria bacterium]|nr:hypothetical protein [Candidatus Eisenbacteria bacterium]
MTGMTFRDSDRASTRRRALPFVFGVAVVLQVLLAVWGSREPVLLIGGIVFAIVLCLSLANTFAGLIAILLFQIRILQGSSEIGIDELAYAALFAATFGGWLLRHGLSSEFRRLRSSPLTVPLLAFFVVCAVSIIPSLVNGYSPLWWFRDLVRFSTFLLIFPVATVARSRKRAAVLVTCFLAVVLYYGIDAFMTYRSMLEAAKHLWQMQWQRAPSHEVLPMTTLVIALAVFLRTRSSRAMIASLCVVLISLVPLAVSLSRGFWAASGLAILILLLVSRPAARRVVGLAVTTTVGALIAGYMAFGWRFAGVIESLTERFSSIASPLAALSIQERLAESSAQLELIAENPIIGHGLGATLSYMSPIESQLITSTYSHNAYLFLIFKLGIAGLVAFLAFYVRGVLRVRAAARRSGSTFERTLMLGSLSLLIVFLPLSITSPQFYAKTSVLVIALMFGMAEAIVGRSGSESAEPAPRAQGDRAAASAVPEGGPREHRSADGPAEAS